jgi:hypothetical protein
MEDGEPTGWLLSLSLPPASTLSASRACPLCHLHAHAPMYSCGMCVVQLSPLLFSLSLFWALASNLQKRWRHVLTTRLPARSGREARPPENFRDMPSSLIPCCCCSLDKLLRPLLLRLAATGRASRATGCRGRASRARPPARGAIRAQGMYVLTGEAHPSRFCRSLALRPPPPPVTRPDDRPPFLVGQKNGL